MQITQISKIYAKALFDSVSDYDKILSELNLVSNVLTSNSDLHEIFCSPAISVEQKIALIDDIFKDNVCAEILNFLKIIAEKDHIKDFSAILDAFKLMTDDSKGIKTVIIVSAIDINDEYKKKISDCIASKINKVINPEWLTDPSIIGGLIIKIDDEVMDLSLRTKLSKITKGSL